MVFFRDAQFGPIVNTFVGILPQLTRMHDRRWVALEFFRQYKPAKEKTCFADRATGPFLQRLTSDASRLEHGARQLGLDMVGS